MIDQPPTPTDSSPPAGESETVAPGITSEWLDNRQIVVFKLGSVARPSIDALLNHIRTILSEWPSDRPYLALYVFGDATTGPTPYIRERFRDIPQWRPELEAHIAFITARTIQGQLVQAYVRTRGNAARIFFNRDEGLAWLRGFLQAPGDR